jgi:hypothetical protein
MQIRKNRRQAATPERATRASTEKELAWAAGAEQFQHRDPLYHVTENFQQTFDRIGRKHAGELIGGLSIEPEEKQSETQTGQREGSGGKTGGADRLGGKQPTGGNVHDPGRNRMWTGNVPSALTGFAEMAFQRGTMAASVLDGTGKMMLVSCLKRTVGESGPKRVQQQSLFGTGSQLRNIPGRNPDQMVFNRTFAKGALGIVVDTIRDARRVVDSMADMAQGTGELYREDSETMRTMYPFLDLSREAQLESEYRARLAACTDEREKPILQNALTQVLALRDKKTLMKKEFINKLRLISDRATETLADLEAPGTLDDVLKAAWDEMDAESAAEGVDGGFGEGAEDDAPDGPEIGDDAADLLEGEGTEAAGAKPTTDTQQRGDGA